MILYKEGPTQGLGVYDKNRQALKAFGRTIQASWRLERVDVLGTLRGRTGANRVLERKAGVDKK